MHGVPLGNMVSLGSLLLELKNETMDRRRYSKGENLLRNKQRLPREEWGRVPLSPFFHGL